MNITLYAEMVHALLPTQYKTFLDFSTNCLFESFSLRDICKQKQILRPRSYAPVIISRVEVREQIVYLQHICMNIHNNNNNNNNINVHIAAIAPLPLTMHPRSWAELLTFGPKCTLPF